MRTTEKLSHATRARLGVVNRIWPLSLLVVFGFGFIEHRRAAAILDLSLLRIPTVCPTVNASLFQGLANFAVLLLVI